MEEKKVTIYDIAAKTNFSAVTVHRALNNKGRISSETKALILRTAEELGYKVNPAAQGLRRTPIRIGAVLFCPVEEYVDDIIDGIAAGSEELEKYNVSVDMVKIPYTTNKACLEETCRQIDRFAENKYNGVIIFASSFLDEVQDLSARMADAAQKGLCIATVANDLPIKEKALHVGIDAFMVGNMAAELLELSCRGKKVALLVASKDSPINQKYIEGFMHCADGIFSSVAIYEHHDDQNRVAEAAKQMLRDNPDLSGIYMATASSALACKCLQSMGKTDLSIITTDLLSQTPMLLKSRTANATIFQNPYRQGKLAVRSLYNYLTAQKDDGVHLVAPQILLASNVSSCLPGNF